MRRLPGILLVLVLSLAASHGDTSGGATAAATALVAALPESGRRVILYPFADRERFDLHLYPFFLDGLALEEMEPPARDHAHTMVGSVLSPEGRTSIDLVRSLEEDVAVIEQGKRGIWPAVSNYRRPDRYFTTLFGEPGAEHPWGFRFDGHHVSINATFVPGTTASVTPFFLGSQPRIVEGGARAGLQVLEAEERLARELLASLDPEQKGKALLAFSPGRELFHGTGPRLDPLEPVGLARGEMNEAQQALLDGLIGVYLDRAASAIAAAARAEYAAAGLDTIRFAWAGSEVEGAPHYYRVHGPGFMLEFDNSLPDADHIHTIWREFAGDFGRDLLAEHYALAHPSGP